jgi:hypothetical protein
MKREVVRASWNVLFVEWKSLDRGIYTPLAHEMIVIPEREEPLELVFREANITKINSIGWGFLAGRR